MTLIRTAACAALTVLWIGSLAAEGQQARLRVTITGPSSAVEGAEHVLTYTVTNIGTIAAMDTELGAYRFVSHFPSTSPTAVFTPPCGAVSLYPSATVYYDCDIGTLAPNQTVVFTGRWSQATDEITEYRAVVRASNLEPPNSDNVATHFVAFVEGSIPALSPAALALLAAAMIVAALVVLRR